MAEVLIIGLGAAGCLLANAFAARGVAVWGADDPEGWAASEMAPGIINPLAGKKLRPGPCLKQELVAASEAYCQIEQKIGGKVFHPTPLLRILRTEKQAKLFDGGDWSEERVEWVGERYRPGAFGGMIDDRFGSFLTRQSGWVDSQQMRVGIANELRRSGRFIAEKISSKEVFPERDGVRCRGKKWDLVVFCEGWKGAINSWFPEVVFNSAKGQVLELQCEGGDPGWEWILNHDKWLQPRGGGRYRAGSTFRWDEFDELVTAESRKEIEDGIRRCFPGFPFRVVNQLGGVRPVVVDYQPVAGCHREWRGLGVLNGLGSRGLLVGPLIAKRFVEYLIDGNKLPEQVSIERFYQ